MCRRISIRRKNNERAFEKCTLAKDAGYKMVSVSTVTKDNALEAIANAFL